MRSGGPPQRLPKKANSKAKPAAAKKPPSVPRQPKTVWATDYGDIVSIGMIGGSEADKFQYPPTEEPLFLEALAEPNAYWDCMTLAGFCDALYWYYRERIEDRGICIDKGLLGVPSGSGFDLDRFKKNGEPVPVDEDTKIIAPIQTGGDAFTSHFSLLVICGKQVYQIDSLRTILSYRQQDRIEHLLLKRYGFEASGIRYKTSPFGAKPITMSGKADKSDQAYCAPCVIFEMMYGVAVWMYETDADRLSNIVCFESAKNARYNKSGISRRKCAATILACYGRLVRGKATKSQCESAARRSLSPEGKGASVLINRDPNTVSDATSSASHGLSSNSSETVTSVSNPSDPLTTSASNASSQHVPVEPAAKAPDAKQSASAVASSNSSSASATAGTVCASSPVRNKNDGDECGSGTSSASHGLSSKSSETVTSVSNPSDPLTTNASNASSQHVPVEPAAKAPDAKQSASAVAASNSSSASATAGTVCASSPVRNKNDGDECGSGTSSASHGLSSKSSETVTSVSNPSDPLTTNASSQHVPVVPAAKAADAKQSASAVASSASATATAGTVCASSPVRNKNDGDECGSGGEDEGVSEGASLAPNNDDDDGFPCGGEDGEEFYSTGSPLAIGGQYNTRFLLNQSSQPADASSWDNPGRPTHYHLPAKEVVADRFSQDEANDASSTAKGSDSGDGGDGEDENATAPEGGGGTSSMTAKGGDAGDSGDEEDENAAAPAEGEGNSSMTDVEKMCKSFIFTLEEIKSVDESEDGITSIGTYAISGHPHDKVRHLMPLGTQAFIFYEYIDTDTLKEWQKFKNHYQTFYERREEQPILLNFKRLKHLSKMFVPIMTGLFAPPQETIASCQKCNLSFTSAMSMVAHFAHRSATGVCPTISPTGYSNPISTTNVAANSVSFLCLDALYRLYEYFREEVGNEKPQFDIIDPFCIPRNTNTQANEKHRLDHLKKETEEEKKLLRKHLYATGQYPLTQVYSVPDPRLSFLRFIIEKQEQVDNRPCHVSQFAPYSLLFPWLKHPNLWPETLTELIEAQKEVLDKAKKRKAKLGEAKKTKKGNRKRKTSQKTSMPAKKLKPVKKSTSVDTVVNGSEIDSESEGDQYSMSEKESEDRDVDDDESAE